jgi:hypothetical protein
MASDEQRVRTMAGWIGVEISRSRVRTPGKAGYGLYRVRGTHDQQVRRTDITPAGSTTSEPYWVPTPWSAYAFELDVIEAQVGNSIGMGRPEGPASLYLPKTLVGTGERPYAEVPTRWTQAYRGRRNLGVGVPVAIKPEFAAELTALAALVDEGLVAMTHVAGCMCSGTATLTAECVRATQERSTVKTRQRASNAEFQAEHLKRRAHGLKRRHAAKLGLNGRGPDRPVDPPS